MDKNITPQLLEEIQKIKQGDYSSYQTFYGATVEPLFATIWEIVKTQEDANILVESLYNYIYANINNELTDDNKFFDWASEKAVSMANAYAASKSISSPGIPVNSNLASIPDGIDRGFGQAPTGNGNIAMGQSPAGNANTMMGQSPASNMNTMMGQSPANTVMGQAAGNMNSAMGQGVISTKTATGVLAKTGMSIGAKIAIGIAGVAVATGIGIGVYTVVKPDHKDSDTTNITTEFLMEEEQETTEMVTEAEITEEVTSEEQTDDSLDEATIARYAAYYDVAMTYMDQYRTEVNYCMSGWGSIDGIRYMDLVDLNGDGDKQLVIVYKDSSDYKSPVMMDVYDYVDGSAELMESIDCGRHTGDYGVQSVQVLQDGDKTVLWVIEYAMSRAVPSESFYTRVSSSDANELEVHSYVDNIVDYFLVDGVEVDIDTYRVYEAEKNSELEGAMQYTYESSSISFESYTDPEASVAKAMLTKHRAVTLMASCAGADTFLEQSDVVFEITSDGYYEDIIVTAANKYNEVYKIVANHDNVTMPREISADGKSVYIYEHQEVESSYSQQPYQVDADLYFTYVEDVVVLVGKRRDYYEQVGDKYEPCIAYEWYTTDDYVNGFMTEDSYNSISEDEFNEKGAELMAK